MATRTTLNVSLTPALGEFVQRTVDTGRYQTASEVVREALRRLQEDHEARQRTIDRLNAAIEIGNEDIRQGRVSDGEAVMRRLRDKIEQHEQPGQSAA